MPPAVSIFPYRFTVSVPQIVDHTSTPQSQVMIENIPKSAKMQPFLVVGISLIAFIVMLMISMIFSFWYWQRQRRLLINRSSRVPRMNPGDLYYRRKALVKLPSKRVRWQAVVNADTVPDAQTSTTPLLNNNHSESMSIRSMYGTSSTKRQLIDTPPPYSMRDIGRLQVTPYRDLPSATTIASEPMSEMYTPPPVPEKSLRRPAALTLIVISPTDSKHHSSIQPFKREPTPYPLASQLTPVEDMVPSPRSSHRPSPKLTAKLRPKLRLKIGDALSPLGIGPALQFFPKLVSRA